MSCIKLFKNCLTWKKKTELGSVYLIHVDAPFEKKEERKEKLPGIKSLNHD